ncbi:hypothetical protein [Pseudomonas sp.]|uniref:hypothetical protein n=1 Tax=Pseudomonas sp. TaxID=306 RepID=UPI00261AB4C4|nr:hypothetical protein [Pseudomonas sp.]
MNRRSTDGVRLGGMAQAEATMVTRGVEIDGAITLSVSGVTTRMNDLEAAAQLVALAHQITARTVADALGADHPGVNVPPSGAAQVAARLVLTNAEVTPAEVLEMLGIDAE